MQTIDSTYESWSKKKLIILVLAILILAGILFKLKILTIDSLLKKGNEASKNIEQVKGESIKNEDGSQNSDSNVSLSSSLKIKEDLQGKLDSFKQQVSNLSVSDIASSSPQVQKIMEDLKNLQGLPKNQAKEACYNICKGL
ncbi:MAG: hypothetical protein Q8P80_04410 [Candidatus Levybacteria bacterium]|nr:hypothetical protein [Candidatus Levybacteria bacterium]